MRPAREAIDHFGTPHLLRASPGVEITVALQGQAMLLDAHVAHVHSLDELVHGQPARALERVENFKPLGAANLGKQFLIQSGSSGSRLFNGLREKFNTKTA